MEPHRAFLSTHQVDQRRKGQREDMKHLADLNRILWCFMDTYMVRFLRLLVVDWLGDHAQSTRVGYVLLGRDLEFGCLTYGLTAEVALMPHLSLYYPVQSFARLKMVTILYSGCPVSLTIDVLRCHTRASFGCLPENFWTTHARHRCTSAGGFPRRVGCYRTARKTRSYDAFMTYGKANHISPDGSIRKSTVQKVNSV